MITLEHLLKARIRADLPPFWMAAFVSIIPVSYSAAQRLGLVLCKPQHTDPPF